MENKDIIFLRKMQANKDFTAKGIKVKKGQLVDQIQTPISARRNWNLIYCLIEDTIVPVKIIYIDNINKQII